MLSTVLMMVVVAVFAALFFIGYGVVSVFGVSLLDYASAVFSLAFVSVAGYLIWWLIQSEIGD
jgi:hypothetical protein